MQENYEQEDQFQADPPAQWHKKLFWGALLIGTLLLAIVYGIWFDSFSETEMVELSFVWLGLLAFSVTGLQKQDEGPRKSILMGILAALAGTA